MIQKQIIKMLKHHFGEVKQIEDGIIRCQKLYHNKPFKVFYLDFTNNWLSLNDVSKELEHYLESVIQNDYYKNAGYLQWNYYYIFVSCNEKITRNFDKKEMIERDKLYARKYIMTLSQLKEWLIKTENIGKRSSVKIEGDLGVEWIKKLKQNKLDVVFLNEQYVNGVNRYIQGNPILEHKGRNNGKVKVNVCAISKINKLKLLNYRKYPSIKEFEFGRVNLIKGVNGSGKTSLFEAIELLICGTTKRNFKIDESANDILAEINKDKETIKFTHGNNKLFKERDKHWYNTITAGNVRSKIYERFNKFNFFNSDAAYQLSYGNQEEIRKAFEDIAIGDEINWLEDRLKKFKDRFYDKLKYYNNIINDSEKELRENKKLLDKISEIDNSPENFFKKLITEAIQNNWIVDISEKDIATNFEMDISSAKYYISNIFSESDWIGSISQDKAEIEFNKLKMAQENVNRIEQGINNIKHKLEFKEKEHIELKSVIQLMLSADCYLKDDKISQLEGIKEKVDNVSKELSKLVKIKKAFSEVDPELFLNPNEKLAEYKSGLRTEIEELEIKLKKVVKGIKEIENNLDQLNIIVTEIKEKGKEYLKLKQDATECPLCHTIYPKSKLIQHIEEVKKGFRDSKGLKYLMDERTKISNKLTILKNNEANLTKLKEVLYLYHTDADIEGKTITEALNDIRNAIKLINQLSDQLIKLKNTQLYFDEKGLIAKDFISIKDQLFSKNVLIDKNYDKLKIKYQDKLKTIQKIIKIARLDIVDSNNRLNNLLEEVDIPIGNTKLLNERIKKIESAMGNYNGLNKIILLDSKTTLITIERNVNMISKLFERYKKLKEKKKENDLRIKISNKKIQELQKKIESNSPFRNNAKKACETITDILNNNSKTDFLKDFIGLNKKLTEISAGQRTALALSVFLTMNFKLKNGPDIILFDEPMTNIDDLNALSFIDYLRDLVTRSDKQVFFATANEDLSYLFKKKFGFLKDSELKEFILVR
jgi:energy-coupling factor transporter ATP-binding protein EcfA2